MSESQLSKAWYKKWWGIILILMTWPVSIPALVVFLVWQKTSWNKSVKLLVSVGAAIVLFGALSSLGDSPKSRSSDASLDSGQVQEAAKQVFDVPALLNKSIDEIKVQLGSPESDSEPTKQQIAVGITEWDKKWTKDGEDILITYNVKTRKVVDVFIDTTDPSGLTSDKERLLKVGNTKIGDPAYDVEFVKAITSLSKFTGVKIIPVDQKKRDALVKERKTFDVKRGNSAFAAQQALEIIKVVKNNGVGADVYIQADVPTEVQNEYLLGGKETTYREKATIAKMTLVINNTAWALAPDTSKRDLVASLVNRLRLLYPNAVPRVEVNNGIRTVAEGSWSVWNGEAKVELR